MSIKTNRRFKLKYLIPIILVIILVAYSNIGSNDEMSPEESQYRDELLKVITINSTKKELVNYLGEPVKDIGLKTTWSVCINEYKDRLTVYFSSDGKANELILDGGSGRFYYRKKLK